MLNTFQEPLSSPPMPNGAGTITLQQMGRLSRTRGELAFPVVYEEGNSEDATFQNADVELPIRSTKRMATGGKLLCYGEEAGVVLNPNTGMQTQFISLQGAILSRCMSRSTSLRARLVLHLRLLQLHRQYLHHIMSLDQQNRS